MNQIQTSDQLFNQFYEKLHTVAADLTRAYMLRYEEFHEHLSSPMLRWLDFRLRYIDPKPRMVLFSDRFPKILPLDIEGSMLNLAKRLLRGDDINAHQGRGLTDFDDISGKSRTRRTDLLWADWAIHHLHLSQTTKGDGYATRSDWLLFCAVLDNHVLFLDVLPHETRHFSNPELIETLFRNWPSIAEQNKLGGIMAGNSTHSVEDIAAARKSGLALMINYRGEAYMGPGLGVSGASTPTRVMLTMDHCMRYAHNLAKEVLRPESQFRSESIGRGIRIPNFELALTKRGLSIFENHSNIAYPLPRRVDGGALAYAGALHDNILPEWAMKCFTSA
jgi:hypothetical protein